jgi:hypothetical protein
MISLCVQLGLSFQLCTMFLCGCLGRSSHRHARRIPISKVRATRQLLAIFVESTSYSRDTTDCHQQARAPVTPTPISVFAPLLRPRVKFSSKAVPFIWLIIRRHLLTYNSRCKYMVSSLERYQPASLNKPYDYPLTIALA